MQIKTEPKPGMSFTSIHPPHFSGTTHKFMSLGEFLVCFVFKYRYWSASTKNNGAGAESMGNAASFLLQDTNIKSNWLHRSMMSSHPHNSRPAELMQRSPFLKKIRQWSSSILVKNVNIKFTHKIIEGRGVPLLASFKRQLSPKNADF